jgi:glucose/mannose-6-phosphate isomerase
MMNELIAGFPGQIETSLGIADASPLKNTLKNPSLIVISGLGGSGIGGTMVADWSRPHAHIPVLVNKDYSLPACVNEKTLFIACSYSGNTEETLEAVEKARQAGASILCITSGGELEKFAIQHGYDFRKIPGGFPPRACLGYSLTQLVDVFVWLGCLPTDYRQKMGEMIQNLRNNADYYMQEGKKLANHLNGKMAVIYAEASIEGMAVRFRQQINENAKDLCWHHAVPEMNHNELVGWAGGNNHLAPVLMRTSNDYPRNQTRMDIMKDIFKKYTPNTFELIAKGNHPVEQGLHLIHLTDWASFFLSEMRQVDVMEVKVIDYLKGTLAKG